MIFRQNVWKFTVINCAEVSRKLVFILIVGGKGEVYIVCSGIYAFAGSGVLSIQLCPWG
jgi:hypothetical protein